MSEILRIFVSATNDLDADRAIVGQVIAQLPVKIAVEIRRTPAAGASYEEIFELIANCDRVYFMLGGDITAPAGAEWFTAWKLERSVYALRHAKRLTPAAQEFVRSSFVEWTTFRSHAELARLVGLDLVRILNHATNRYGLTTAELGLLNYYGRRLRARKPAAEVDPNRPEIEPGGAEGGGVLLDELQRDAAAELFADGA